MRPVSRNIVSHAKLRIRDAKPSVDSAKGKLTRMTHSKSGKGMKVPPLIAIRYANFQPLHVKSNSRWFCLNDSK